MILLYCLVTYKSIIAEVVQIFAKPLRIEGFLKFSRLEFVEAITFTGALGRLTRSERMELIGVVDV